MGGGVPPKGGAGQLKLARRRTVSAFAFWHRLDRFTYLVGPKGPVRCAVGISPRRVWQSCSAFESSVYGQAGLRIQGVDGECFRGAKNQERNDLWLRLTPQSERTDSQEDQDFEADEIDGFELFGYSSPE
jgi:hypothetical protein